MFCASLFPLTDPTWIFFVVLCIILLAPILLNRLKIPHIIGMLLTGVLVGPHGIDLLARDSSFEIFGNVGLLYIMFLAGVEIDLADFKKNKNKSLAFGIFTFLFPFLLGYLACHYVLSMNWMASLLMASMFSSHTLVTYTIASRFGVAKNQAVNMAVCGTMITDTLSLIVLAVISRMTQDETGFQFWATLAVGVCIFISSVIFFFPRIARAFFRRFDDQVLQFIFVLGMLFLSAIGANLAGLEGILGAFLAGLVLNRLIPANSALMGRLKFVGNALFIPYFLIGVGMLIDVKVFFHGTQALMVAGVMTVIATLGKYLASWTSQTLFHLKKTEGLMLFGLSEAHTAGTLAIVMVGYRLGFFDENVLNGTLILILITCIISSLATEKAARQMILNDEVSVLTQPDGDDEKILIPVHDYENVPYLMQAALLMRNPKLNRGLIGLSVVYDTHSHAEIEQGQKCLLEAEEIATAADVRMQLQNRLATNLSNGIIHALRENDASEIILGLHKRKSASDSFFGGVTLGLINGMSRQITLVRFTIPANTIRRIHVMVPPKAEFEPGFYRWADRLSRMANELGCRILFYLSTQTAEVLRTYISERYPSVRAEYLSSTTKEEEKLTKVVLEDHLLVIISARKDGISYHSAFEHIPEMVTKHFSQTSVMIIYPDQLQKDERQPTLMTPQITVDRRGYEPRGWLTCLRKRFSKTQKQ